MGNFMVKEQKLQFLDLSMKGDTRMGKNMVKEHTLSLVEDGMMEVGKMDKVGQE